MGWYGWLARTKAYFRTFTYCFQASFFSYMTEIRTSDVDAFYFKLAKISVFPFLPFIGFNHNSSGRATSKTKDDVS